MTKLATIRSAQRLCVLLIENKTLAEIETELARVVDGISQLRDPTTVLPFPIRPEVCLSEVGEEET